MSGSRLRRNVIGLLACIVAMPSRGACVATLPGTNVAGGEFNAGKLPGVYARDYVYPDTGEVALMKRLDLKLMRVPVLWERIQPTPFSELDPNELSRIDHVAALAHDAGLTVVLDLHNYGAYRGVPLDRDAALRDALPDVWRRLARHFAADHAVVFGLMNEPKDFGGDAWSSIARSTLAAIRSTGSRHVVLVPGAHWDGAHSWFDGGAQSSAQTLLPLATGDDRVVFEVHQYFDGDYSGTSPSCPAAAAAVASLRRVGDWARSHRVRVMLGEFGVSERSECVKALDDALAAVEADRGVWWGWTYWAAGAWWGDYPFNIQKNETTPQARVLADRARALGALPCVSR